MPLSRYSNDMNIAIIPARGGSQRIPRKNIKMFHGKPLIAYSIEAAKASGCFKKIIVSTDDDEISEVAQEWGAEVPFLRPSNLADNFSTTLEVMQHAVEWCISSNIDAKNICCIYATAPFLLPEYLKKGLQNLINKKAQYSFSATSFTYPIQRAIKLDGNGFVEMFNPENINTRSQDLEEAYHDAGQFYWGRANAFLNKLPLFSEHSSAILLPRDRVQDIDTLEDWEFAEALYKAINIKK